MHCVLKEALLCTLLIIKMPMHISIKRLENLVLDTIAETVSQFAGEPGNRRNCSNKNYELLHRFLTPFAENCPYLANKIHFVMMKNYHLCWPAINFLGSSLTVLDFSGLVEEADDFLNERSINNYIILKCPRIERICLNNCTKISCNTVKLLVKAYRTSLKRLELQDVSLSKIILVAIGNCTKLTYLDISKDQPYFRLQFRDLKELFRRVGRPTKLAQRLEAFHMNHIYCERPIDFNARLFHRWCPNLLEFSHHFLFDGLVQLCKLNKGPKPLNLKRGLDDTNKLKVSTLEKQHDIPTLFQCLPEMHSFYIIGSGIETKTSIVRIIQNLGIQLTTLDLEWDFPLDFLKFIGPICPNLEAVYIHKTYAKTQNALAHDVKEEFETSSSEALRAGVKTWSKLRRLKLSVGEGVEDDEDVTSLLKTICKNSAGSLKELYLFHGIHECVFDFLTQMFHNHTLSSLIRLCCVGLDITSDMIWNWLTLRNNLRYIQLFESDIEDSEKERLLQYIRERNLDVKFDIFYWNDFSV
ncbi:unnamed protein product [Clavelina lepadiformis]|uniref:Uncharacterized protein n=1 Tax=Clavelina lepadiformis TaxID=159417 RepID=A0ABP0G7W1_CLALP